MGRCAHRRRRDRGEGTDRLSAAAQHQRLVFPGERAAGHLRAAGGHRHSAADLLCPGCGQGLQERHLHHERCSFRLADPHVPCRRFEHDGAGAAAAHAVGTLHGELQEPARVQLADRFHPLHPGAGDFPDRLSAPLEPALLLGHHRGHQQRQRHSGGRSATWWSSCAAAHRSARPPWDVSSPCTWRSSRPGSRP